MQKTLCTNQSIESRKCLAQKKNDYNHDNPVMQHDPSALPHKFTEAKRKIIITKNKLNFDRNMP